MRNSNLSNALVITLVTSTGMPSTCSELPGALDYDVTLRIDGREPIIGWATLAPDAGRGGDLQPCGGDLHYWLTSKLVKAVQTIGVDRLDLVNAIVAACTGDVAEYSVALELAEVAA